MSKLKSVRQKVAINFNESEHPRDSKGRFTAKNNKESGNKIQAIENTIRKNLIKSTGTHNDFPDYATDPEGTASELSKKLGISKQEAEGMAMAINEWGNSAYDIKEYQKTGKIPLYNPDIEEWTRHLDNFLKSDKVEAYGGEIHRGLAWNNQKEKQAFIEGVKKEGLSLNSHSSFSSNFDIANQFSSGGSEGIIVSVKNNKKGKSVSPFSYFKGEDEVLVSKDVKYRYLETKKVNNIDVIEVEEYD